MKRKHTSVVDLVIARVNGALEQLIDLLLAHLLAQIGQDVLDLALADEAGAVLVKHLEAAYVFFNVKGLAEAAGAVEDLGERLEVDCGRVSVVLLNWSFARVETNVAGCSASIERKEGVNVQSAPTPRSRSAISASVGF